ncbi:MAG: SCO family protein [Solirubrobacteraceae bacterium]
MSSRRRFALPLAMGLLVLGALAFAILAGGSGSSSPSSGSSDAPSQESASQGGESSSQTQATGQGGFDGAILPVSVPAPGFQLTDQYGRSVSLAAQRGSPVLIAFLYSRCGATCILIAQQIRGALDELARPVPVLLISADPATDTPASVRRFLAEVSLSGRVHYLTGTSAQLRRVWREYHVTPASAGAAAFDRFATVVLVDPRGRERVLYGQEQLTPEALVHDIDKLEG